MNLVLDTCVVRRHDEGQSCNKKIDYVVLEKILNDPNNELYITPFTYAELCCQKYNDLYTLDKYLKSQNIRKLTYNELTYNECVSKRKYNDPVDQAFSDMNFLYTRFLKFFCAQIIYQHNISNLTYDEVINFVESESLPFYIDYGEIRKDNCTKFMSVDSVKYLMKIIKTYFRSIKQAKTEKDIWKIIGNSKMYHEGGFERFNKYYFRYGDWLINLFKKKSQNKNTEKVVFKFGFIDLLNAYADGANFCVISADLEMCRFIYKYTSQEHKDLMQSFWKGVDLSKQI